MYLCPRDPTFRKIWVRNLHQDHFKITQNSKLCDINYLINGADGWFRTPHFGKTLDIYRNEILPTIFDYGLTTARMAKTGKSSKTSTFAHLQA